MKAWRMAPVYYLPAHADVVVARITSWAAMADPISRGPGLDQGDATQLAAHMAFLRHVCAFGAEWDRIAWFQDGRFYGVRAVGSRAAYGSRLRTVRGYPIIGEEPLRRPQFGDAEWPWMLAAACDNVLRKLAKAETGDSVESGWGAEFPSGAEVTPAGAIGAGGIAIIVAGAAVAVIGTAAAWRYLAPEARIETASIAAAARAYEARLRLQVESGVELPPSPIEQAQAERVRAAASESKTNAYLVGAATVAGIGGGMTIGALIRSRVSA